MKHEQLEEAIKFYCFPKFFLGEAIANSLLAGAPPMDERTKMLFFYCIKMTMKILNRIALSYRHKKNSSQ